MKAKVVVGGRMSDPFDVLAPVIFNLFLVAVTLASRVGFPPDAGVPFIYRLDGSLFNIRRLTAETKVSHDLRVFELQYADDAALPAHSATTLQGSLDVLSSAYNRAGLNVNAKKTEVLSLSTNHDSPASLTMHGDHLVEAWEFTYLGSILRDDRSLNSEIEHRIKAASSAFGRLLHQVFLNHNLAIPTKVAVYKAVRVSVLLCGCEAWTLYRRHVKALEAFHIRSLQTILRVHWWQKIPHIDLFSKANITPVEHLLVQRQLRWLGHVIPDNRLPRRLLYGELSQGQRSVGCPKKRFLDYITLEKCNIQLSYLEVPASDKMSGGLCVMRA